jgi:hypothetical protein
MRIVGAGLPFSPFPRRGASATQQAQPPGTEPRALIAIEAPHRSERATHLARRPAAPFLAQLIATQLQAPQTRARRRAEPDEAIAVYRSMTKPVAPKRGTGTRA